MKDGTRAGELDGIEWFARLCARWFWLPLVLGLGGGLVGLLLVDSPPTDRQVRVELGLSDSATWPFPDSVMPRAIAAIESGRVAQDLGLEASSIVVEPGEGLAPMTVVVTSATETDAIERAQQVADYLVEDSFQFATLEERTSLSASEAAIEREDAAIEDVTQTLAPIEKRVDELDGLIEAGEANEADLEERRGLIIERDQSAAELRGRIDVRADAIVDAAELEDAIAATAPMLESYGLVDVALPGGSSSLPLVAALVGFLLGLVALPMLDDRFGSLRTPAAIRRSLGDVAILDFTETETSADRDFLVKTWATDVESAALVGASAKASLDTAAAAFDDSVDDVELLEELNSSSVSTLAESDLVLLVVPTKSLSPIGLRAVSRRLDSLGIEPKAIALTSPSSS